MIRDAPAVVFVSVLFHMRRKCCCVQVKQLLMFGWVLGLRLYNSNNLSFKYIDERDSSLSMRLPWRGIWSEACVIFSPTKKFHDQVLGKVCVLRWPLVFLSPAFESNLLKPEISFRIDDRFSSLISESSREFSSLMNGWRTRRRLCVFDDVFWRLTQFQRKQTC